MSNPYPPVESFFSLGRVLKAHGTDGRLRIAVEGKYETYLKPGAFIFFDLDGSMVPYPVGDFESGTHQVLSLAGIDAREHADALQGKELWLPEDQVRSRHKLVLAARRDKWTGYTIQDEVSGRAFVIERTEEFPQQLMAIVVHEGREVLIPLHEDLIVEADHEAQVVTMRLPEGLLEL